MGDGESGENRATLSWKFSAFYVLVRVQMDMSEGF